MSLEISTATGATLTGAASAAFLGALGLVAVGVVKGGQLLLSTIPRTPNIDDLGKVEEAIARACQRESRSTFNQLQTDFGLSASQEILQAVSSASGTLAALKVSCPVALVAQETDGTRLEHAIHQLETARVALSAGDLIMARVSSMESQRVLDTVLEESKEKVRRAHHRVVTQELQHSLGESGFSCDGEEWGRANEKFQGQKLLRAHKGMSTVTALLDEQGRISLDFHGYCGAACQTESDRLFETLKRRGVFLQRTNTRFKRPGGAKVRQMTQQSFEEERSMPVARQQRKMQKERA